MNEEALLASLTPDIVERFKLAIEIGKWPDGKILTDEQRETCLRTVILYEHKNVPENERTGYVPPKETPCTSDINKEEKVRWK